MVPSERLRRKNLGGFIIRDSDGQGVVAGSGRLSAVADVLSAEGEACLAALHAAMARRISRVIVESDSTNLVSALSGSNFDRAPGGAIFCEACDLLAQFFVPVSISSIPRNCNRCAHELARLGLERDPDCPAVWDDPFPDFVSTLMDRDHADLGYA